MAHDSWLVATPAPGASGTVRAAWVTAETFPISEHATDPARVASWVVLHGDAQRPVTGFAIDGLELMATVPIAEPGVHVFASQLQSRFIELAAAEFNTYLAGEGAAAALRERRERNELDRPGREQYTKCAKAIWRNGDAADTSYLARAGHSLEIVPQTDPAEWRAGGDAVVRVYLDGRPAAGLRVSAGREGLPPHRYTADAVTGEDGLARVQLDEPGLSYLRTFAIRRLAPGAPAGAPGGAAPDSPAADWESFWASMTFRAAVAAPRAQGPRNVAIIVHEGVELLDFAGPGEVFEAARLQGADEARPWFTVYAVAPSSRTLVSQRFLTIKPEHTIESCPAPDILVIPGGATGVLLRDEAFMAWFRKTAPRCEVVMSVCTGAFVLGEAGLLDGQEATTHWSALDSLRRDAPRATVVEGRRFVDGGRVVTTAGVSAGIDGALHVVARLLGRDVADRTARYMEYDWRPDPAAAAAYSLLNPMLDERGRLMQQAQVEERRGDWAKAAAHYRSLTEADPRDAASWYHLGRALHAGGDLDQAIAAHRRASEFRDSEHRFRALYNLACATALLGRNDEALAALDAAVDAGFDSRAWIESDADLDGLRADPRFAAILERLAD